MEARKPPEMGKWEKRLALITIVVLILMIGSAIIGIPSWPFGVLVLLTGIGYLATALAKKLETQYTDWSLIAIASVMTVIAAVMLLEPKVGSEGILRYGQEMGWW